MIILPENKPKEFDKTPRIFFIWGESMSGKTYLARQFPNPIILNTDGNADKIDTPSIKINDFKHLVDVLTTLEKGQHTFKTIIIDLIDDIDLMLKNYVVDKANESLVRAKKDPNIATIGEIPFGQGYDRVNSTWKNLMMNLSKLPYNIIFISHIIEKLENNAPSYQPSLPQKPLNVCLGRCDLQIQTKKLGSNYIKMVTNKRDNYTESDIKDPIITKALAGTMGLYDKNINKGEVR